MFCMSKCDNDTTCNGYSIDYSNNGCFLSSCNLYTDVPTCSTCLFASKKNLSSFPSCPSYTNLTAFTTTSQSTILTDSTTMTVSNTFLPTTTGFNSNKRLNHPTILKTGGTAQNIIVNSTLCVCVCNYVNQTVEESKERRRKELTVNKTQISSFIRKLTSATDDRKVSELIGTVAIIIMVIFGLIIAYADICSVLSMRFSKRTNCRKETHQ